MGIPGQFDHPRFQAAIDQVVEVSARHGVAAGVMQGTPEAARSWMERGYRAIAYGSDISLLLSGLRSGLTQLREG
jgi:2-dehydro-3-deoxyglucarate aldolase/4-hydroxy-2-oxoheptanedioate aldolase